MVLGVEGVVLGVEGVVGLVGVGMDFVGVVGVVGVDLWAKIARREGPKCVPGWGWALVGVKAPPAPPPTPAVVLTPEVGTGVGIELGWLRVVSGDRTKGCEEDRKGLVSPCFCAEPFDRSNPSPAPTPAGGFKENRGGMVGMGTCRDCSACCVNCGGGGGCGFRGDFPPSPT